MNHRLLAAIVLMLIFGTQCRAQDAAERSVSSNLPTEPATLAAENVEADLLAAHVIIIEMSPDMRGSELIRGVIKSLEEDGIAKTVPMNTSFIRPLDFNAKILVSPNLSSDSIRQVVKTLNDLRVRRVTLGMTNPNGTNDLILTCPPDVTWREVRNLQDTLKNHNEFKVDVRVVGTDGPATSTYTPTYANEPKLPAGDAPDTSGDNPLPSADSDQRSVSVRLRYRDATAIARIIRQVLIRPNGQPFGVVTDEQINEIRIYGASKLVHEAEHMLRRLDVPENQWMGSEDGYQSPPPTQPALQSSNATDATGEFLKQEIADFSQRVEDLDGQESRTYGSAFLPAMHQGTALTVPLDSKTSAIENLRNASASEAIQRRRIDLTQRLNQRLVDELHGDASMEGMIQNMELAFRMQTTTPQLVDMSNESEATLKMYGVGGKDTDKNARACLLARKLSESGVRFVQVTMDGWDHHGDIRGNLPRLCSQTDQPVAALVKDLKQRGMLEDTLVLWSGEFGRTPWSQDLSGTAPIDKHGREHQPQSFCAWMAGGGIKPGLTYGETDPMGYQVIDGKVHLHDLHATMLYLLGLDHTRLTRRHLGRDFRLTDVYGSVVKEILA